MVGFVFVREDGVVYQLNRKFVFGIMYFTIVVSSHPVFQVFCTTGIIPAVVTLEDVNVPHLSSV